MPTEEEMAAAAAAAALEEENKDGKTPGSVPYSRLKEVIAQRAAAELKLAEAEAKLKVVTDKELEDSNQYRTLAEERRVEIEKLKSDFANNQSSLDKYRAMLTSTVNEMTGAFQDEVKAFDPGEETEPLVRFEWARKAQVLVDKLNEKVAPVAPPAGAAGVPPKPVPKDGKVETPIELPASVKNSF